MVPGLGLVLVSRTRWRGGRSRLVPAEQIDTVVINEVRLPSQLNASSMPAEQRPHFTFSIFHTPASHGQCLSCLDQPIVLTAIYL